MFDELAEARAAATAYRARAERAELAYRALEQRMARTAANEADIAGSRSWQLTPPLRAERQGAHRPAALGPISPC